MTIRYQNGNATEAILVTRTANSIRVAMPGAEDIAEFREVNGTWISEDCEPATIEFAVEQIAVEPVVNLDECICPPELASRLVMMLHEPVRTPELETAATIASALFATAGSCIFTA